MPFLALSPNDQTPIGRRAFGKARTSDMVGPSDAELECAIMELLVKLHSYGKQVSLRDLHKAVSGGQPRVLRTVRKMVHDGKLTLQTVHHDPLASLVQIMV